jgi:hypothetical protein
MSKYGKMEGLTELVVNLRDEGAKWDAEGGIVDAVRAAYPGYTTKSAIPLRKLYHAAKAKPVKATKARVLAGRKAGKGWARLATELKATEAELKKLAEGTEWAEGRVYLSADGSARIVDLSATVEADEAEAVAE